MSIKVAMISLGCPKNQVEAEHMLALLADAGCELVGDASEAQVAVVNTCGFIDSAKQEAIDSILEMAALKQQGLCGIVVTGCLAERYRQQIRQQMPEVDVVLGGGSVGDIVEAVLRQLLHLLRHPAHSGTAAQPSPGGAGAGGAGAGPKRRARACAGGAGHHALRGRPLWGKPVLRFAA